MKRTVRMVERNRTRMLAGKVVVGTLWGAGVCCSSFQVEEVGCKDRPTNRLCMEMSAGKRWVAGFQFDWR